MSTRLRILVTGGGTGGHTTPLVAVGKALQDKGVEVLAISEKKPDALAIDNFETYFVSAGKFRRYNSLGWQQFFKYRIVSANMRDAYRVMRGIIEAVGLLRKLRPDAVFIKGGYVSLPVGLAARLLNIPYVTHDSDVLPGLTNRLLARGAQRNLTGFPVRNYSYDPTKAYQVGVPIQPHFLKYTKAEARAKLGLPAKAGHIVITGGSIGAQVVNEAVMSVIDKVAQLGYVSHFSGKTDYNRIQELVGEKKLARYAVFDHVSSHIFALHLISADVVVTRAGATTLTELSALEKATIIVPNPFLTGGHQLKNANVIQSHDAARLLHQAALKQDPNLLVVYLDELLASPKERQWLGKNLKRVFKHNAAVETANVLMGIARESHK